MTYVTWLVLIFSSSLLPALSTFSPSLSPSLPTHSPTTTTQQPSTLISSTLSPSSVPTQDSSTLSPSNDLHRQKQHTTTLPYGVLILIGLLFVALLLCACFFYRLHHKKKGRHDGQVPLLTSPSDAETDQEFRASIFDFVPHREQTPKPTSAMASSRRPGMKVTFAADIRQSFSRRDSEQESVALECVNNLTGDDTPTEPWDPHSSLSSTSSLARSSPSLLGRDSPSFSACSVSRLSHSPGPNRIPPSSFPLANSLEMPPDDPSTWISSASNSSFSSVSSLNGPLLFPDEPVAETSSNSSGSVASLPALISCSDSVSTSLPGSTASHPDPVTAEQISPTNAAATAAVTLSPSATPPDSPPLSPPLSPNPNLATIVLSPFVSPHTSPDMGAVLVSAQISPKAGGLPPALHFDSDDNVSPPLSDDDTFIVVSPVPQVE